MQHQPVEDKTSERIDELCDNLERYVREANEQGRPDSPARHFHIATINRIRSLGLAAILDENLYFEYLYATLATWGMDSRGAKLKGFESFVRGIRSNREQIVNLSTYTLDSLVEQDEDSVMRVISNIWQVILAIGVAQGKSQLVAGSKTLHHLLPDLVPPIDRRYTLKFFFDRTNIANAKSDFAGVFINYLYIFEVAEETIRKIVGEANPLNSSVTKVIDNAIIAYQAKGKRSTWTS
jgi:hypothetical protein